MAKRVYIAVEDDPRVARRRMEPVLDFIYRNPGMTERVALCGPGNLCAEKLERLIGYGAYELVLTPLYDELAQLEKLARVVEMLSR